MNSAATALLSAAAGVGFGHAILPDHWVPLAVLGRTQKYPLARVARLSFLAGIAHVIVSLALGAIIILVGLQLRSTIESVQSTIVGTILILTGVAFVVLELTGHGHGHSHDGGHEDEHSHAHARRHEHPYLDAPAQSEEILANEEGRVRGMAAIMVPFGAAASPDLTILPVFLAAAATGVFAALGTLVIFSVVTIATIVGMTLFACFGGYQMHGQWLERWGNVFTATVLAVIGALVLTGVI